MIFFHNYLCYFLLFILIFVYWLLLNIYVDYNDQTKTIPDVFTHSSDLELIWTIIPAFILILIAIPSFLLLYSVDELTNPLITVKVIGHQWYWTYDLSDLEKNAAMKVYHKFFSLRPSSNNTKCERIGFDSYFLNSLKEGTPRLLMTDNALFLPVRTNIRILVTSADVIHSWAIPSFGIKVDACPGRLTQASLYIKRTGLFMGQCSEICGMYHGYMPISIAVIPQKSFLTQLMYVYLKNYS
jgi:cytochrome c oxidase subunit 2